MPVITRNGTSSLLPIPPIDHNKDEPWLPGNIELNDILDTYKTNTNYYFTKVDLKPLMPAHYVSSKERLAKFNKLPEKIYLADFVTFLHIQTAGRDYMAFDFLIRHYNVPLDKNYMPIFKDGFHFDRTVKKEAVFIYSILKTISKHSDFKQFNPSYFNFKLQDTVLEEICLPDGRRRYKMDLSFINLKIIVEIDELGHIGDQLITDYEKDAHMRESGYVYLRLDFRQICDSAIKKGEIIDNLILNNEYYEVFLADLMKLITNALQYKYQEVYQHYILKYFKESIFKYIEKDLDYISEVYEERAMLELSHPESERIIEISSEIQKKNGNIYVFNQRLLSVGPNSDFITLFEYKKLCKENLENKPEGRVISFDNLLKTMKIIQNDLENFKLFLYDHSFIDSLNINKQPEDTIFINWYELIVIINEYDGLNDIKILLIYYYGQVENSYEEIINNINAHTARIIGSGAALDICLKAHGLKAVDIAANSAVIELKAIKIELAAAKTEVKSLQSLLMPYVPRNLNIQSSGEIVIKRRIAEMQLAERVRSELLVMNLPLILETQLSPPSSPPSSLRVEDNDEKDDSECDE